MITFSQIRRAFHHQSLKMETKKAIKMEMSTKNLPEVMSKSQFFPPRYFFEKSLLARKS